MQPETKVGRAEAARWSGALDLLRLLRTEPGITRTEAARVLQLTSGSATEICARLRALGLLSERPARPGGRGRPTFTLHAHPEGPLAVAVDLRHAEWCVAVGDLEGRLSDVRTEAHRDRSPEAVLAAIGGAVKRLSRRYGPRVRAVSVSVIATVQHHRIAQASGLGWEDVEVAPLIPGVLQLTGNNANLAGLAEARRVHPDKTLLFLTVEAGVGGVFVDRGRAITGATGAGGEFGHLPFGDPSVTCGCGAQGCWETAVDGRFLARRLGRAEPDDPGAFLASVLAEDSPESQAAVKESAAAFGRGTAGLVNALDPEIIAIGGAAPDLRRTTGPVLDEAYGAALMHFRRSDPPELQRATLGEDAALLGAADAAFDEILTEYGLNTWSDSH
ncbi:ROK family transcriptional regulator [Glycomyces buryatensis]|uniref:ROK family transcriptional regulator n=1 Tax=Glycomyces buryatensis TaxID=2570927 RepID=A0A4S8QFV9_9ACTN|nr:ROK family transcriptional regulator [Glycomyces buryatensis]THV40219.1 ROK family transcriptional regulator [Glycomyces buryatensis]